MPRLTALLLISLRPPASAPSQPAAGTTHVDRPLGEVSVGLQCAAPSDPTSQRATQRALVWRRGKAELSARVRVRPTRPASKRWWRPAMPA